MILALYVFLIFIGLLLAQEIFRRFPKFTVVVFVAAHMLLAPYWVEIGVKGWFLWTKAFSIIIGVIWFAVLRLTKWREARFYKIALYLFLLINIFEAVVKDALGGSMAHYFNAAAGILLMLTVNKIDSIGITKDKYRDVSWSGMTLMWIIGYTIWNWTFIYLNLVQFSAQNLAVLGAPLLVAFFNKNIWLQARAVTLSAYIILTYSFPRLNPNMYSYHWVDNTVAYFLAEFSCIFMIIYAIFFLRSSSLQRSDPEGPVKIK